MANEERQRQGIDGERIGPSIYPPALTDFRPYSGLRGLLLSERPSSVSLDNWLSTQYRPLGTYWSIRDYYYDYAQDRGLVDRAIGDWLEEALRTTDMTAQAAKYTPIGKRFVAQYYQAEERSLLRSVRREIIAKHSPQNAIILAVDPQVAFAAAPGSPRVREIIKERSFCVANLSELADFIKQTIDLKSWVVLTTMQQGGRTTIDRWHQQQKLGLVAPEGGFLLCPEGSSDVMIHPLLLYELGFGEKEIVEFQRKLLEHSLLSDAAQVCCPFNRPRLKVGHEKSGSGPEYIGFHLPVMVKPQRGLDIENFRQVMAVGPTDIFLAGADINICIAEIVEQLKYGMGHQPNIWIIYDLATTRPADFSQAQEVVSRLADGNFHIYLCSRQEAVQLLGRNKITYKVSNLICKGPFPPFIDVIDDLSADKVGRSLFRAQHRDIIS